MENIKNKAIEVIKNPKTWGVATVFVAGCLVGDWRGVSRANKQSEPYIDILKDTIKAYEKLTRTLTHRNSIQTLTINAYDNLANTIAGGGNPDDAMEKLFQEIDFINVVRTAI